MSPIPPKLRAELAADPFYSKCARPGPHSGRITWEHALLYANKQIQAKFAIIPLCWFHHLGPGLDKRWNKQFAMSRMTPEDKHNYPRL